MKEYTSVITITVHITNTESKANSAACASVAETTSKVAIVGSQ